MTCGVIEGGREVGKGAEGHRIGFQHALCQRPPPHTPKAPHCHTRSAHRRHTRSPHTQYKRRYTHSENRLPAARPRLTSVHWLSSSTFSRSPIQARASSDAFSSSQASCGSGSSSHGRRWCLCLWLWYHTRQRGQRSGADKEWGRRCAALAEGQVGPFLRSYPLGWGCGPAPHAWQPSGPAPRRPSHSPRPHPRHPHPTPPLSPCAARRSTL